MDLGENAVRFDAATCEELIQTTPAVPMLSAELLAAALKQAGVGTWQVDLLTGLTTWDAVASDLIGYCAIPSTHQDLQMIHVDDRELIQERFERHAAIGGSDDVEFRITRPDGEIRWLHASGRRLEQAAGGSRYLVGIITDITDQKIAAENLREAEERYRLISQVTTDIIFDWDIKNDRISWNEAKGAFFGYTATDVNSISAFRFKIHPDDQERVVEEFRELFSTDKLNYASDHRLQNSGGEYLDVHACGTLLRDANGRPTRLVGSIQDVSERRYADAALRESEAINRGIVEASTDSVALLDLAGNLLFLNKSSGLTSRTKDFQPFYGTPWILLWPEHARSNIVEAMKVAAAGGQRQLTESFVHDGGRRWWDILVSPIRDEAGTPIKLVAISRDVTQRREADDKLRHAAMYDSLTHLPNRACFQDRLSQAVTCAAADRGRLGLLLLDVDDFKQVNDNLGHDAGDALLASIAARLDVASIRPQTVARLGGDEFAVLLEEIADEAELATHAEAILKRMKEPLVHSGRMLDCQVTIGAALFPDHGTTPNELLKSADIALYVAKVSERGAFATFEHKHRAGLRERAQMVATARTALSERRVIPFYQPKLALQDRTIHGFEALLRWRHPTLGTQSPASIAAAFEDPEVANSISQTMIDLVIGDMRAWLDQGLAFEHVAVNAGAIEFRGDDFAETVLERLHRAGVPTRCLQLEVTETVFLGKGAESVGRALQLLDKNGVHIALDDFGTGYASLRHLKQFPVHVLKIDQGFVQSMETNSEDSAIISAVVNLGRSLAIDVVAEGIETLEQEAQLRELGCKYGQGFLYSKAVPSSAVPGLLSGHSGLTLS